MKTQLRGKINIIGEIKVLTGLSIGGNKSGIDIGALDNPVIKTFQGIPYIPGSSLKGKLRSLIAKVAGTNDVDDDVELYKNSTSPYRNMALIFGFDAKASSTVNANGEALLKVRDSYLKKNTNINCITEEKFENSIDRVTSKANPRPIERVVHDNVFELDLVLDVYDEDDTKEHLKLIDLAIDLLKNDYLGGSGTRGNGKVDISIIELKYYKINSENISIEVYQSPYKSKHLIYESSNIKA